MVCHHLSADALPSGMTSIKIAPFPEIIFHKVDGVSVHVRLMAEHTGDLLDIQYVAVRTCNYEESAGRALSSLRSFIRSENRLPQDTHTYTC